ncbi:MAG: carboxylate-amine ligase [Rhodobacteraceae bacterium]|nr:carboxylate-amine ligase [Paracoccaceae bacterium]
MPLLCCRETAEVNVVAEPSFTMGIEEEYLLVHTDTLDLAEAPQELMDDCAAELGDQVSPEFLRCQVEVGTGVCSNITEAREDLRRLRGTVARIAGRYGMAPLAVSCHPTADWKDQHHTDKERYKTLDRDLAGVARRLLISGMHVHVGIEDRDLRIDLLSQAAYFLPHLLALSCSSPFWQGEDTGLACYRLTIFDNVPRTGHPPVFHSWTEYQRSVQAIIDAGAIEDATKIWWDLRPSARFPTLESRICDNSPRMEHALSIAALTQCVMRMLWRLRVRNQRWRIYDEFLVGENRWRAQRYGMSEGLIDFGRGEVVPFADLLEEMIELVQQDAETLGCLPEIEAARDIVTLGNSADRQRAVRAAELESSADNGKAMRAVVQMLIDEFTADL